MGFIRFFTISIISVVAFGTMVYALAGIWRMNGKPAESRAQIAAMHLSSSGIDANAEEVRKAAESGDLRSLKLLGIAGINFNEVDDMRRSAIHIAIENEQWGALKLVEKFGGDLNYEDKYGETPISKLIEKGRIDLAGKYVEKGASIQFRDTDNTPALMSYLIKRDYEAFDFLLENKANPNTADANGSTPLQLALELGLSKRAFQLLDAGSTAKNLRLKGRPVIAALAANPKKYNLTSQQTANLVTKLIMAGADPEEFDPNSELRPVLLAIRGNNKAMFDALMTHDVDTTDCVWESITQDRGEMLESLLSSGVSCEIPGEDGDTPLVSLVRSGGKVDLVKILLDYGADPDQYTKEGQRLLFMALVEHRSESIFAMLNHENKPDVKSPMSFPVSDSFRKLYSKKGLLDWYCKNVRDVTPLMVGIMCDDVPVVERMIALGAERNKRTTVKVYPIQIACDMKNIAMQQLILGVPHQDNQQKRNFIIDLSEQMVYFYQNGALSKKSRCSTGKSGFRTRTGEYVITDKEKNKVSNIYKGAKMPYFQRFSCDDFGFHEGNVGSRYASHGCIRLPMSVAKSFFYSAKVGDRVLIRK